MRHLARFISAASIAACLTGLATAAHAGGGLTGVDAMTATVFQEGQSSFSGLAVRFRVQDPRLLESIDLTPTIEYWRNSSTVDAFDLHAVRRDATLGADIRYMLPGDVWRPYFGTGLAVHFLSSEVDAPRFGIIKANDSLTKGGLTLLAGVAFGTHSRIGNFVEVKGHFVGGYRQLKLNMGLSWNRSPSPPPTPTPGN